MVRFSEIEPGEQFLSMGYTLTKRQNPRTVPYSICRNCHGPLILNAYLKGIHCHFCDNEEVLPLPSRVKHYLKEGKWTANHAYQFQVGR